MGCGSEWLKKAASIILSSLIPSRLIPLALTARRPSSKASYEPRSR